MTDITIRPFTIGIAQADRDDPQVCLARTRWSGAIPGTGRERGVPSATCKNSPTTGRLS
jgi:epoxide hydrolase